MSLCFPGHISCGAASRSKLVVPLIRGPVMLSVLDLDSPAVSRFDAADQAGCEAPTAMPLRHLPPA